MDILDEHGKVKFQVVPNWWSKGVLFILGGLLLLTVVLAIITFLQTQKLQKLEKKILPEETQAK